MTLRIRTLLSLSHALVIGIFIVTFLAIFFTITKPPGPPPGPHRSERLSRLLQQSLNGEELERGLKEQGYRAVVSADLYDREGQRQRLFGPDDEKELPEFALSALKDGASLEVREGRGLHLYWQVVNLDGPRSHILRIEQRRDREHFFQSVRRNMLLSCGIAFLAVLLIALLLSRWLAEPIRELAGLVDRFGREGFGLRSEVTGTAEVVELSNSFNHMAEYIEKNTNELREQKDKAERTEALRRQFLSDVSHNLRTPLAAIMGWNDALIDGVADDEKLYRLRIRREVLHVTKIVQRLLELSRWERAAPVLLQENVLLSELLLEVAENLQESAEQNGVTLEFEGLPPDLSVKVDRQKARDVLQILLENVVEHAGRDVCARVVVTPGPELVRVSVEDNGEGLPDTFRPDSDLVRGASEVGRACLGLAIASRLVKAHGGVLTMQNREEGGTRASFTFPCGEA